MSSDKKKNVIKFPNPTKKKALDTGEKYSGNLINKKDQSFWIHSHSLHGGKKGLSKQEEKIHTPIRPLTFPSPLSEEQPEETMPSPVSLYESELQGSQQNKSRYIFTSVACALFFMLVCFPFLSRYGGVSSGRGLACKSDDLVCERQKQRELLRKKRRKSTEANTLHLIQAGHRELASVGRKPKMEDIFSMELLNSRYDIKWKRGKLVHAVLSENQKPVRLPAMHKVIARYHSLFPDYNRVSKLDTLSGDLEIYALLDAGGVQTGEVETLRDMEGRLLSIHVMW